jgi:hypothetical protein
MYFNNKRTSAKLAMSIPFAPTKTYGIKGVIWKTSSGVHQETWYDDNGSGQWKKAGSWDRPSCGQVKTSTSPHPQAQVEFRIDCDNVTYSKTDVAVINPSRGFAYVGPLGYLYDDDVMVEEEHTGY